MSLGAIISGIVGGHNGGKEPTRTGQGTKPQNIDEAIKAVEEWLKNKLGL